MSFYQNLDKKSMVFSVQKERLDCIRGPDQIIRAVNTPGCAIGWEMVSAAEYCKVRYHFDPNRFFGATLPWRGEYEDRPANFPPKRRNGSMLVG